MKFPTLSRIFSIVLALFSGVLLFTVVYGYIDANSDIEEANYKRDLLNERIAIYEEYAEKLSKKEKYSNVLAEYNSEKSEYDKEFAEHRTDLSIYSATKGGLEDGISQLEEADRELYKSYQELLEKREEYYCTAISEALKKSNEGLAQCQSQLEQCSTQYSSLLPLLPDAQIAVNSLKVLVESETATPEQIETYNQAKQVVDSAAMLSATIPTLEKTINDIQTSIDSGAIEEQAKAAVDAEIQPYLEQISAGSGQIWQAKQVIIANQDKLEEDRKELEEEKDKLVADSIRLQEYNAENEQLKADENKLESTRILLEANDNIKSQVDNGVDIVTASKNESERLEQQNKTTYRLRLAIFGLLLLAAVFGLLTVPCAFEFIKSHVLLIISAIVFIISCALAEYLSIYLGRGHMYSVIVSGIFGVIALLIFIPKAKTIY